MTDNIPGDVVPPDVLDDRLPDEPITTPAPEAAPAEETPENAAPSEEPSEEEEETGDDAAADAEPKKKGKGVQKRLDELTRQREDAKRERDYWRQMAMQGQPQQTQPAPEPVTHPQQSAAPRVEDFPNDYEAYLVARAKHEVWTEINAQQQAAREAAARTEAARRQREVAAKVEAIREKYEDYDAVVSAVDDVVLPAALREAVADSEITGELAYHLAKNPAELRRLAALSPIAAVRELGRIESKLMAPPPPAPPPPPAKAPKAPPPIKPVNAGDKAVRDPASMSMEEYIAHRRKAGA